MAIADLERAGWPLQEAGRQRGASLRRRMVLNFAKNVPATSAVLFFLFVLAVGALAPVLAPADPARQDLIQRLQPPSWQGGPTQNLLGTDQLGRDVLSRLIFGARVSLTIALAALVGCGTLGIVLGLLSGFYESRWSDLIMRVADVQIAFPFIVVAIAVIAVLGTSIQLLVLLLVLFGWISYGRVARAETLSLRERDFITAARLIGSSDLRIIFRHILPNVWSPLLVVATLSLSHLILAESSLSFLGLGVQPPDPSWGSMLSDGRQHLTRAWWLATFPGLAIMVTVMAVNIIGDALRDVLDPRLYR